MPKKKSVKKIAGKKAAVKKTTAKKASVKKSVSTKAVAAKSAVKKAAKKVTPRSKPAVSKTQIPEVKKPTSPPPATEPVKSEPSLGRPLVTQEEKLYMLFHDDYQARQVFEFLRVNTVKELEQFSQQQIVHMMSKPLRMTVDRIRQRLAEFKRSLKDDEHFAVEFRKHNDEK